MKKLCAYILALALLFTFTACNNTGGNSSGKPIIAVSIMPQAAFAEAVFGDDFEIITMIPAGASPETYEPTPSVMKKLNDAEIYFSVGVPAEEFFVTPGIGSKTEVVALHEKIMQTYPDITVNGGRDPHIWLSVKRVKVMVTEMARAASELHPENLKKYEANAADYIKKLDETDEKIRKLRNSCNTDKFITFHPAFGYFADEYSLEMYALEEDGKEATPKRLAEMADLAKAKNIKVIFYQSENSSKQAVAFAEEIKGKAVVLDPLDFNYTENLENMANAVMGR